MIKTYISALLVVLLAGAQMVQAQNSMDDVLAQLDAANDAGGEPVEAVVEIEPVAQPEPAAPAEVVAVAPAAAESTSDVVPAAGDKADALYQKGNAFFRAGDYDNARRAYEAVIVEDPYYSRATTMLKRTAQRISSKEGKRLIATRTQAFAAVESEWSQEPVALGCADMASGDAPVAVSADQEAIQQMEARMKAINIPGLDFRDATIEDVALFLSESSRRIDSTGKGVNILFMGMESEEGGNTITTSITDINLYDALQVVAGMASLKVEVRANAVAVMPADYVAASEMAMKSYDVLPEVGSDLEAAGGDDGGGSDDLFGDSSSSDSDTGPVDVASFFTIVDFPEGSSATYQPRFHKLFVKNTPANLKQLEAVLADLNEEAVLRSSQQVEIEAKFVEFNEGALAELGFDWNVYGSGSIASMEMDGRDVLTAPGIGNDPSIPHAAVDPLTGQVILSDGGTTRPGQNLFGTRHRTNGDVGGGDANNNINEAFGNIQSGIISTMGGPVASMMFGNGDIDVTITAMEQEGTADVLSAPKVTTKSGSEAIIRVAETHRYPQDYDVETGQRTSPVVKPQDWEDFDLGVTLKGTPEVKPESNTIDLTLHPEEVKFLDYEEYKVGSNGYGSLATPVITKDLPLIAKMPFFRRRSVETQVTIADGQTIVMGGLVDERTETFRDQVPFLGDIPYLGRLFRTEGSRSVKKNLVIYVTATQVDASGLTTAQRKLARQ